MDAVSSRSAAAPSTRSNGASVRAPETVEDSSSKKAKKEIDRRIAGILDAYMMNLGIILAGVVVGWNSVLSMGAGEYLISLGLCSLAYLCLALCVSEMASAISFAGGSFGYGRCTLSPFIGYMIGIFDLLQTILCAAQFVDAIAQAFVIAIGLSDNYRPLWWFIVYGFVILIALPGGRFFWNSVILVTVATLVMMLIYILGLSPEMNFDYWAMIEIPPFAGSTYLYFCNFMVPTVCYIGVDLMTVFGDEIKNPQRNIPIAMVGAIVTTILFAFACTITSFSVRPGVSTELMGVLFPLHIGFEQLLHATNAASHCCMGITLLSSAVGFVFVAGRQMSSMARSGLLPPQLDQSCWENKTPALAMVVAALIGICALLPVWGINKKADDLYEVTIVGASLVYLGLFWCFLVFKYRFGSMDRVFVSPLGVFGAIYGIIYFSLCIVTILFVQLDFNSLIAITPYTILAIIYYYKVAEARQFFSKEEQAKFMKAYIMNANKRKKKGPQISDRTRKMHELYSEWGLAAVFGEWDLYKRTASVSGTQMQSNHRSNGASRESSMRSVASTNSRGLSNADVAVGGHHRTLPSPRARVIPISDNPHTDENPAPPALESGSRNNEGVADASINQMDLEANDVQSDLLLLPRVDVQVEDAVVAWSGKILDIRQSRQFFELVNKDNADVVDLVKELPDQFIVLPSSSAREHSGRTVLTEVTDSNQSAISHATKELRRHNRNQIPSDDESEKFAKKPAAVPLIASDT